MTNPYHHTITMTTTIAASTIAAGAAPMAPELADAYLDRIFDLLVNLEAEVTTMADASWGSSKDAQTARYVPTGTREKLTDWMQRISGKLQEVCQPVDVADHQ